MSRNLANSGFYDEGLIDHRNERPLAVAFATILIVWTLAFGLVSLSGELHAQSSASRGRLRADDLDDDEVGAKPKASPRLFAALAQQRGFRVNDAAFRTARP